MIYINQLGHCELGRGDTFKLALENAQTFFPDLEENDVARFWPNHPKNFMDGDVVWTNMPQRDYQ